MSGILLREHPEHAAHRQVGRADEHRDPSGEEEDREPERELTRRQSGGLELGGGFHVLWCFSIVRSERWTTVTRSTMRGPHCDATESFSATTAPSRTAAIFDQPGRAATVSAD